MHVVIPFSILLGLMWNVLAVRLMSGRITDAFSPSWILAGALAGVAAGLFTVWSRKRREGEDRFLDGIATYYLGVVTYWAGFVVVERVGIFLIPLCALSRYVVWRVHERVAGEGTP